MRRHCDESSPKTIAKYLAFLSWLNGEKLHWEFTTFDKVCKLMIAHRHLPKQLRCLWCTYLEGSAQPQKYQPRQLVLLDEHRFIGKNEKLPPKCSGPYCILPLKGEANTELLLKPSNKKLDANVYYQEPYFITQSSHLSLLRFSTFNNMR